MTAGLGQDLKALHTHSSKEGLGYAALWLVEDLMIEHCYTDTICHTWHLPA